jgi:Asp-tRNA(Asn)/Glu-tRNA(Gln) amidotransferase A subunit family amidase
MRLDVAASIPMSTYLEARSCAVDIRDAFVRTLCEVDVMLSPVSAGGPSMIAAPDRVDHLGSQIEFRDLVMNYTTPQNLAGLPACSVAIGIGADGMPIGVQITARHGMEELVLGAGAALQRSLPMPLPPVGGNGARH